MDSILWLETVSWIHDCHCILLALKYINLNHRNVGCLLLIITPTRAVRCFVPDEIFRRCDEETFRKSSSSRSPLLFFLSPRVIRSKTPFSPFSYISPFALFEKKKISAKKFVSFSISSFEETNDPILSTVEATREEGNSLLNSRIILHFSGVTKLRKLYGQPTNRLVLAPSSKT